MDCINSKLHHIKMNRIFFQNRIGHQNKTAKFAKPSLLNLAEWGSLTSYLVKLHWPQNCINRTNRKACQTKLHNPQINIKPPNCTYYINSKPHIIKSNSKILQMLNLEGRTSSTTYLVKVVQFYFRHISCHNKNLDSSVLHEELDEALGAEGVVQQQAVLLVRPGIKLDILKPTF